MVEELSSEDLQAKSLKELKAHIKALQKAGYPIDYEAVKTSAEGRDDVEKYYRKKIRHAQRTPPKKRSASPKKRSASPKAKSSRYAELDKLSSRSKNELCLQDIALEFKIPRRTQMTKPELINAIIEAEKEHGQYDLGKKSKPEKKVSPKKVSPKKKVSVSEEEEEEEEKPKKVSPKKKVSKKVSVSEEEEEEEVKPKKVSPKKVSVSEEEEEEEVKPKKVSPKKDCGQFSHDELLGKRMDELRALLKTKGIDASGVEDKKQAADIFCQFSKYNESCGSGNEYACGDDRVCNLSVKTKIPGREGICVEKDVAVGEPAWFEYKGRQIVGSKEAIDALRKRLAVSPGKSEPDPLSVQGLERSKLMSRAIKVSGKSKAELGHLSNKQLSQFIEGHAIKEQKTKTKLAEEVGDEKELTNLTVPELRQRAKFLAKSASKSKDRSETIEILAAWLDRDPSEFNDWSDLELNQRLESLREWDSMSDKDILVSTVAGMTGQPESYYKDWSVEELKQRIEAERGDYEYKKSPAFNRNTLISTVAEITGHPESSYKDWAVEDLIQRIDAERGDYPEHVKKYTKKPVPKIPVSESEDEEEPKVRLKKVLVSESESEEEIKMKTPTPKKKVVSEEVKAPKKKPVSESESEEEEEDEEKQKGRKMQEDISYGDVEKVLSDVMAGKKGKIEELSQVQNAVLKCLGLVSA